MYINLIEEALASRNESIGLLFANCKKLIEEGVEYGDPHCFIILKDAIEAEIANEVIINASENRLVEKYGKKAFQDFVVCLISPTLNDDAAGFLRSNRLNPSQQSLICYCLAKATNANHSSLPLELIAADIETEARLSLIKGLVIKLKSTPVLGIDGLTFKESVLSLSKVIAYHYYLDLLIKGKIKLDKCTLEKINSCLEHLCAIKTFLSTNDYCVLYNDAATKSNSFIKTLNKRLFRNEFSFDKERLEEAFDSLGYLCLFIRGALNKIQNDCLREHTTIGLSLDQHL